MTISLKPISTGMKNGPEAIQDNFDTVSKELDKRPVADTGWIPVTIINGFSGSISVRRKDDVIYHKGQFSTAWKPDTLSDMRNNVFIYPPEVIGDVSGSGQIDRDFSIFGPDGASECYGFVNKDTNGCGLWVWKIKLGGPFSVSSLQFTF
jgi:hypothetical protein